MWKIMEKYTHRAAAPYEAEPDIVYCTFKADEEAEAKGRLKELKEEESARVERVKENHTWTSDYVYYIKEEK